ncbi:hypothetical protein HNR60_004831 [Rhodopseudomonas rhenobacensis]|uniref:Sulfotransferase family protein n=1 Tax=Rhodopseudomonas rhenobacensis TaxID=87461 RepID=A0A7W8E1D1_9BRAD|nr:hypothetical protein [Rhodopseudomonas rhenobacensis]MBB5050043.1 hypothetical protein [Rhodopseudomonas rhenobacensis]
MSKRAILHVGVHKTGTTSIQAFAERHRSILRERGIDFYTGVHLPNNHVELHVAAMRPERLSPFKMDNELVVDESYREAVRDKLHAYVNSSDAERIVFSSEGLSYLRYADEMERLKSLIPTSQIEILFYVRDREAFLRSYRREMRRHRLPETIDPDSYAYTADNTWLANFAERIEAFSRSFGAENVAVIDYDRELGAHGNIIPSFLRALKVEDAFDPASWRDLFLNTSDSPN